MRLSFNLQEALRLAVQCALEQKKNHKKGSHHGALLIYNDNLIVSMASNEPGNHAEERAITNIEVNGHQHLLQGKDRCVCS
jgi:pyrimidine deaminase RibD-like protein